jgi:hypothetical protein
LAQAARPCDYRRVAWAIGTCWRIRGVTVETVAWRIHAQGFRCPLCGRPLNEGSTGGGTRSRWRDPWQLDHDHITGRFRGVLHGPCNVRLGWVEGVGVDTVAAYLAGSADDLVGDYIRQAEAGK